MQSFGGGLTRISRASIGKEYKGSVRVTHFVRVLKEDVGYKRIAEEIQVDLSSLHLAPHYGCHYTKPSTIYARIEDPENPKSLDELIEVERRQVGLL